MAIEVTGRHLHLSDEERRYAAAKADAVVQEFPQVEYVHVILDGQKHLKLAEVVVQAKNHVRVEAAESADLTRVAMDMAFDKIETQLRKVRAKVVDHKGKASLAEFERAQRPPGG